MSFFTMICHFITANCQLVVCQSGSHTIYRSDLLVNIVYY